MIDIACNDPDNGLFAHVAEQIQIGDQLIELEARHHPPPRFVELRRRRVRLAGKVWQIQGSKEWVGNWCWNSYWFNIQDAVYFLDWLHNRNLFDFTCGESRLFTRWKWREPFTQHDRDFLRDQLSKPSNFHRQVHA